MILSSEERSKEGSHLELQSRHLPSSLFSLRLVSASLSCVREGVYVNQVWVYGGMSR